MKFENKTAIVTGAGGNIGRFIAKRLAEGGARVAVVDFVRESAEETVRIITEAGGTAKAYVCDVKEYARVHECCSEILSDLGKIDILVTAAGGSTRQHITTLAKQTPEIISDNIGVNLFGALWFAKEAAADFELNSTAGRIVFVASIIGEMGGKGLVEYSAGKGGIIAMSKSIAKELGHLGATVNCVSPGLVNRPNDRSDVRHTNFLGELCTADDIAGAVEFLASDEGRFITGQDLAVDGGRRLALKGTD